MEIEVYGNRLKLVDNEIYCYRKIKPNSKKMDWCKITFTLCNGYLTCLLSNNKIQRKFSYHRLIYYFYNPEWDILNTELVIDHINRDKLDNSIENLRSGTQQENNWNRGAKGCYFHKQTGKWVAQIAINKKNIYLGLHNTEEEDHEVYLQAKKKYHIIIQNIV